MKTKLKMVYWKREKIRVGELVDHPEIMTQGETIDNWKRILQMLTA
jgi:hypothetical protein